MSSNSACGARRIDRATASYCRERLHRPFWQFAWKITNWAKGLPWIVAEPLIERFGVSATARASFGLYNTVAEADALVAAVAQVKEFFA